jgi:hypothetical protein
MRYVITATIQLDSRRDEDRVAKLFESVFEFGTIKEAIAEGLQLLDDPRLLAVDVKRKTRGRKTGSVADAP